MIVTNFSHYYNGQFFFKSLIFSRCTWNIFSVQSSMMGVINKFYIWWKVWNTLYTRKPRVSFHCYQSWCCHTSNRCSGMGRLTSLQPLFFIFIDLSSTSYKNCLITKKRGKVLPASHLWFGSVVTRTIVLENYFMEVTKGFILCWTRDFTWSCNSLFNIDFLCTRVAFLCAYLMIILISLVWANKSHLKNSVEF